MIKKIEDLTYYELLEVSPTASSQEIYRAYERVRRIYDPGSIALYSLFSAEETASIHKRIEEAYQTLMYESHRRRYDETLKSGHSPGSAVPGGQEKAPPVQEASSPAASGEQLKENSAAVAQSRTQEAPPPFDSEFTGPAIKSLREQRNMTVGRISEITKIGARYIELIEAEDYKKLPARPYLRGFLILYAQALGYDPARVVSDYFKRYEATTKTSKER